MRILFLADNFPPEKNAQASRVYERACYWVEWGHEVTVVTGCPNFPEGKVYTGFRNQWRQISWMSGIRVVRVKTFIAPNAGVVLRILDFLSFLVTGFLAGLWEREADVVVATSPQFFAAVAGWALAVVKRKPFVMELSDLWPDSIVAVGAMQPNVALRMIEKIELFLYRKAARIVALTPAFKRNLVRRGVAEEKIAVVLNGVDLRRYAPRMRDADLAREWGIGPEDVVVGYAGTLGMAHGLENVLEAASGLGEPVKFVLVGPGAERQKLISEVERRGLGNVLIPPPQPKEKMPAVWSVCDIALVHLKNTPLFRTVIPSKMFEAMGMGLPIVLVAPEGEASAIVEDERVGIFVPAGNAGALRAAVETMAQNRRVRAELAENSRRAAPRHSRERQAAEMLTVLMAAAGQRALAASAQAQ